MDTNVVLAVVGASAALILVILLVAIIATRRRDHPEVTEQFASLLSGIYDATQRTSVQIAGIQASSTKESQLLHEPMSKAVLDLQKDLAALQATARQQHELEVQTAGSIRKLELILAGAQGKGAAGEHIIESLLAHIPVEWQVRDFRVGTNVVEFGLRLPNRLILPIDSKWVASGLVEQLANAEEPEELQRIKGLIESSVRARAREVNKYVGSSTTASFGLVVIPDSVFEVCRRAQIDVFSESRVMVVSHSLFVPYLLLVYQAALTSAKTIDMEQLDGYLEGTIQRLDQLQADIVRIDRAVVSLRRTPRPHGRPCQPAAQQRAVAAGRQRGQRRRTAPRGGRCTVSPRCRARGVASSFTSERGRAVSRRQRGTDTRACVARSDRARSGRSMERPPRSRRALRSNYCRGCPVCLGGAPFVAAPSSRPPAWATRIESRI